MANPDPPAAKFADGESLARTLGGQLAANLKAAISARGLASLVVSGGKSPTRLFELLRTESLDWSRVCVALADERWVDPSDPDSNEKLVRDVLLKESASAARFIGLKNGAPTPDLGAVSAWETFARVPRPFDAVLLGMGDDGHTASLFPRSPNLASALNPAAVPGCVGMRSPVAPHPRLSLNLSALLDSRRIVVLITGAQKWNTYRAASADGPALEMPIRCVLRQRHTPVEVMWAP
ncbi:MAG TPA: 6-phosphogluconolactonase [Steroidobacteraceae bacterium]